MRTKIRFGDILEIPTFKGLAYALYTHKHVDLPRFGDVIHKFEGLFSERPDNLESTMLPIQFTCFLPLQNAVNRGFITIVGNVVIPENLREFPIFREGLYNGILKKSMKWWLWDGNVSTPLGELTPELRKLPILSTWTVLYLIEMIEAGWRPETHSR